MLIQWSSRASSDAPVSVGPLTFQTTISSTSGSAPREKNRDGELASYGALMQNNGATVSRLTVFIGVCANNEAEYQGALAVLRHALSVRCSRIFMYGDSKLVVSQINDWAMEVQVREFKVPVRRRSCLDAANCMGL